MPEDPAALTPCLEASWTKFVLSTTSLNQRRWGSKISYLRPSDEVKSFPMLGGGQELFSHPATGSTGRPTYTMNESAMPVAVVALMKLPSAQLVTV